MPQHALKSRKAGANKPPQKNKKAQKSNLKMKKGKTISSKKSALLESKKLKKNLEKAINVRIEEDAKALASNEATSFKILKGSDPPKTRPKKK